MNMNLHRVSKEVMTFLYLESLNQKWTDFYYFWSVESWWHITWMLINLFTTPEKRHTTLWNADLFHLTEVRLALPSKKRWQHTATSVLWNNILSLLQIKMLFTVSNAIKTLTSAEAMFKMSPLALDASTKMGAPLLHCSINDTLISRILRCQNMFTKLIKRSWFDVCTGL